MHSDAQTAALIERLSIAAQPLQVFEDKDTGIKVARIPIGDGKHEIVDLTKFEHRDAPKRVLGVITLHDAASFIEYLETFKGDGTRLYFNPDNKSFAANIDHPLKDTPSFTDHKALYPLRHSEEWKIWSKGSGVPMSQTVFGQFLEDNLADIIEPAGGALIDAALNFQTMTSVSFKSGTNLRNGQTKFEYVENTEELGSITLPQQIALQIPIFFREAPIRVEARIRYEINKERALMLRYEIIRPERLLDEAAHAIVQNVRAATALPIHFGVRA